MIFQRFQPKKILILLIIISLSQSVCFGLSKYDKETARIKKKISKLRREVNRLKAKMLTISSRARVAKIVDLVEGHEARVEKLVKKLAKIERAKLREARKKEQEEPPAVVEEATEEVEAVEVREEPAPATAEVYVPPEIKPEQPAVKAEEPARRTPRFKFEIGGVVGIFSAATGAFGEVRFPLRYIFGPATTSFRLAGGLAQSEDMSRRYAPIQLDGILNFPAGWFTGVENYLGAGLNYVVLTSGRKSGAIGGQFFYGVESGGFGGKMFGELGYGILRTGFSPSHNGLSVLFGYRRNWGLF